MNLFKKEAVLLKILFLSWFFSHPLIFLWSEKAVHISVDKGGYPLLLLFMAKRGAVELELYGTHIEMVHIGAAKSPTL